MQSVRQLVIKQVKLLDRWQKNKPKIKSFKDNTSISTARWKCTEMIKPLIEKNRTHILACNEIIPKQKEYL